MRQPQTNYYISNSDTAFNLNHFAKIQVKEILLHSDDYISGYKLIGFKFMDDIDGEVIDTFLHKEDALDCLYDIIFGNDD